MKMFSDAGLRSCNEMKCQGQIFIPPLSINDTKNNTFHPSFLGQAKDKKSGFRPRFRWGGGVGWKSGFFHPVEWQLFIWKGQNRLANWIPSPWSTPLLGCRRIKPVISKFLQVSLFFFFNDSWNFRRRIQMKHMPSLKANLPQKKASFHTQFYLTSVSLFKILAFQVSELKFSFQLLHLLEIPNGLLKNWQSVKEIFHNWYFYFG